jgi:hypothetical protein
MENTFNLKKFLAEGALLKEEQEGDIVDFLNQYYGEAFEEIIQPSIELGMEEEGIDDMEDYIEYISKDWFFTKSPTFEECADFNIETTDRNIGFIASFEPFTNEQALDISDADIKAINDNPHIIEGKKVYVYEYDY